MDQRGGTQRQVDRQVRLLVQENGQAMFAYAMSLTGDHAAAEDVVQEAMVRAWRHVESLHSGAGSVRGWLLTVIRNIVYDKARARRVRPIEVAEPESATMIAEDYSNRVVDSVLVVAVLRDLSVEHREALESVYLRGNTMAEAAVELGVPQGTVKSRAHRAIRTLRESMPASLCPAGAKA